MNFGQIPKRQSKFNVVVHLPRFRSVNQWFRRNSERTKSHSMFMSKIVLIQNGFWTKITIQGNFFILVFL